MPDADSIYLDEALAEDTPQEQEQAGPPAAVHLNPDRVIAHLRERNANTFDSLMWEMSLMSAQAEQFQQMIRERDGEIAELKGLLEELDAAGPAAAGELPSAAQPSHT